MNAAESAREAAALHLWDEGIVRPESAAFAVVDFLVREGHMSLSSPPADDVREALAARLAEHAERFTRYAQPCGVPNCPFMVRRGDGGWNHLDTHGADPEHAAIGLLTAAARALSEVRPYGTVTDAEVESLRAIRDKVKQYADDRYYHARSRLNILSSWRVWSDLYRILGLSPKEDRPS